MQLSSGGVSFGRSGVARAPSHGRSVPILLASTCAIRNLQSTPFAALFLSTMTSPASFASFVKDTREKKKNEALAQQILGNRGRKANASGAGVAKQRSGSQTPTLLSRISSSGVQKRSSSAKPDFKADIDGKWQHDLHKLNNPNGPPAGKNGRLNRTASSSQADRNSRTYDKFASVLNRNANSRNNDAHGFNIRGVANGGPFTVIASNFAPGTTAADIEAVMSPHGGETLSCRLISAFPTVMVELEFLDKQGAENVIATFNNQKVGSIRSRRFIGLTNRT